MSDEDLSPAELQELKEFLGVSHPTPDDKASIISFFKDILKAKDTTKVSNLDEEELASIRIYQSTALYAEEMGLSDVAIYLKNEAEVILASADSKKGFLVTSLISTKKELQLKQSKKERSGWFKKKVAEEET